MEKNLQKFGGDWTQQKLECINKYLNAYQEIMKDKNFLTSYIDAFAGTGYRTPRSKESDDYLPEFQASDSNIFLDGSARVALQTTHPFSEYYFVEKDSKRCSALENLKIDFPKVKSRIKIENAEANAFLKKHCLTTNWTQRRSVLFLDPFGMEVDWETIRIIARTRAIDTWILFPLGIAVNRLLKKDGNINEGWRTKLNRMFGTDQWYDAFYRTQSEKDLFGNQNAVIEKVDIDQIGRYFVERLKTVFPAVADNPLKLVNSVNCPLYLLCFAAGNPKVKAATKIASHILGNT